MELNFTKMHGIGNDYVYVNAFETTLEDPGAVARAVSPRHTGIGSDGLILIAPSDTADLRMEMYNADGSRGEMCGNGIRCVGKFGYDHGLVDSRKLTVETDAGIKTLSLSASNGRDVDMVTVDMGEPSLEPADLPMNSEIPLVDGTIAADGRSYEGTCVSMGNPHLILFVPSTETAPVHELGPVLEAHPMFPNRINVEFVEVVGNAPTNHLRFRVWERGSGETHACGTGACAAAVAAVLTNRGQREVRIDLLGGSLDIQWRTEDNHVLMTGGATEVYSGKIIL